MANSTLKCRYCGERKPREEVLKLNGGNYCGIECTTAYGREKGLKAKQKETKQKVKKQKAQDRKTLEELKTLPKLIEEAQKEVNRYVRLRDRKKPCISCGRMPEQKMGGSMDAGHYRSRASAGHLRFNLLGLNSQCVHCNRYLGGNYSEYRVGLIERIGIERVERLEQDNRVVKFTKDYVRRVRDIFRKRANWYQKRKGN